LPRPDLENAPQYDRKPRVPEECDECPFNPINEAEARRREESRLALGQILSDALAERNKP